MTDEERNRAFAELWENAKEEYDALDTSDGYIHFNPGNFGEALLNHVESISFRKKMIPAMNEWIKKNGMPTKWPKCKLYEKDFNAEKTREGYEHFYTVQYLFGTRVIAYDGDGKTIGWDRNSLKEPESGPDSYNGWLYKWYFNARLDGEFTTNLRKLKRDYAKRQTAAATGTTAATGTAAVSKEPEISIPLASLKDTWEFLQMYEDLMKKAWEGMSMQYKAVCGSGTINEHNDFLIATKKQIWEMWDSVCPSLNSWIKEHGMPQQWPTSSFGSLTPADKKDITIEIYPFYEQHDIRANRTVISMNSCWKPKDPAKYLTEELTKTPEERLQKIVSNKEHEVNNLRKRLEITKKPSAFKRGMGLFFHQNGASYDETESRYDILKADLKEKEAELAALRKEAVDPLKLEEEREKIRQEKELRSKEYKQWEKDCEYARTWQRSWFEAMEKASENNERYICR